MHGDNISKGVEVFSALVWPALRQNSYLFSGYSELIHVEGDQSRVSQHIDRLGGIDYFVLVDKHLIPIASKIQQGGRDWETFTVRQRREGSEFVEGDIMLSRPYDAIGPYWTVQAYTDDWRELVCIYVAKSEYILDRYIAGDYYPREYPDPDTGERITFAPIRVDSIKRNVLIGEVAYMKYDPEPYPIGTWRLIKGTKRDDQSISNTVNIQMSLFGSSRS